MQEGDGLRRERGRLRARYVEICREREGNIERERERGKDRETERKRERERERGEERLIRTLRDKHPVSHESMSRHIVGTVASRSDYVVTPRGATGRDGEEERRSG